MLSAEHYELLEELEQGPQEIPEIQSKAEKYKDPKLYEKLLHIAGELGVPGAHQADLINQQIHPVDLIIGILKRKKKKKEP